MKKKCKNQFDPRFVLESKIIFNPRFFKYRERNIQLTLHLTFQGLNILNYYYLYITATKFIILSKTFNAYKKYYKIDLFNIIRIKYVLPSIKM